LSLTVMLLVIFGAVLHATWNAIVKSGSHTFLDTVLVAAGAALVAGLTLPLLPLPHPSSWPYLGASFVIHIAYFSFVVMAYRGADLSYAYPLMRGSAPLFSALLAFLLLDEPLTLGGWMGIVLLCTGILLLAADAWRSGAFPAGATAYGLANAAVIVSYTLVDGVGVRSSGFAPSYIQWLMFLNGFPLFLFALITGPRTLGAHIRGHWGRGFLGGICTAGSYGIALWAMTHAPIALVAALRETSVIFGTIIAAVFLKEGFGHARYVAAGLVVAGAITMKVL
jgi:drug/metabolite transporter (DMT)-like permease